MSTPEKASDRPGNVYRDVRRQLPTSSPSERFKSFAQRWRPLVGEDVRPVVRGEDSPENAPGPDFSGANDTQTLRDAPEPFSSALGWVLFLALVLMTVLLAAAFNHRALFP